MGTKSTKNAGVPIPPHPCEGVEGSGENRNSPPLFAILAFKMAKVSATPQNDLHFCKKFEFFATKKGIQK